jgi:hypothetical protein
MRRAALITCVLVLAAGCGESDELDLGDLSDRTVPGADRGGDAGGDRGGDAGGGRATRLRREGGSYVDTCSVLTEDEVAAATGLTVIGSEEEPGFGCVWFVENIDPSIIADDAITFRPYPAAQFDAQRAAVDQGLAGEEIEGLGDAAYYIGTETLGSVWVLVDVVSFEVGNQFAFSGVEGRAYQEALARAIADALR